MMENKFYGPQDVNSFEQKVCQLSKLDPGYSWPSFTPIVSLYGVESPTGCNKKGSTWLHKDSELQDVKHP